VCSKKSTGLATQIGHGCHMILPSTDKGEYKGSFIQMIPELCALRRSTENKSTWNMRFNYQETTII